MKIFTDRKLLHIVLSVHALSQPFVFYDMCDTAYMCTLGKSNKNDLHSGLPS